MESRDCCLGDLFWGIFGGAGLTGRDHVGLEKCSLKEDVVVVQGLVDESKDGLSDLLGSVKVMVSVRQDLE